MRDTQAVPTNLEQKAAPTEPRHVPISASSASPSASRTGSPTGSPESALVEALLRAAPSEAPNGRSLWWISLSEGSERRTRGLSQGQSEGRAVVWCRWGVWGAGVLQARLVRRSERHSLSPSRPYTRRRSSAAANGD